MINLSLVLQIFVLLNPLASFPLLMAAHKKKINVKTLAIKAVLTAFFIALIITLIGPFLFNMFGITLDSFRIAGGVVLFLLGISMVNPHEEEEKATGIDSMISIMATPLLTGPATISFITIKSFEIGIMPVIINICLAFILVGIIFYFVSLIISKISAKLVDIISRVMGLFLTAVAIEMIAKGISGIIIALS